MSIPRFRPARTSQQKYRRIILFRPRIGNEGGENTKNIGEYEITRANEVGVCAVELIYRTTLCVFFHFFSVDIFLHSFFSTAVQ